jgi:hypothetical protein
MQFDSVPQNDMSKSKFKWNLFNSHTKDDEDFLFSKLMNFCNETLSSSFLSPSYFSFAQAACQQQTQMLEESKNDQF